MRITEIVVSAGRVVSHPIESYSNLRPQITLKATVDEGEDFEAATKQLQAKAEKLVEDHKENLIESIIRLDRIAKEDAELNNLENQMKRAQARLDELRSMRKLISHTNGDGIVAVEEMRRRGCC